MQECVSATISLILYIMKLVIHYLSHCLLNLSTTNSYFHYILFFHIILSHFPLLIFYLSVCLSCFLPHSAHFHVILHFFTLPVLASQPSMPHSFIYIQVIYSTFPLIGWHFFLPSSSPFLHFFILLSLSFLQIHLSSLCSIPFPPVSFIISPSQYALPPSLSPFYSSLSSSYSPPLHLSLSLCLSTSNFHLFLYIKRLNCFFVSCVSLPFMLLFFTYLFISLFIDLMCVLFKARQGKWWCVSPAPSPALVPCHALLFHQLVEAGIDLLIYPFSLCT